MDELVSEALQVPVVISEAPLDNVAQGAGELLEHMNSKKKHLN